MDEIVDKSVVCSVNSVKRLVVCPHLKRVNWGYSSSHDGFAVWNMCSLDSEHCSTRGRGYKFKVCKGGYRVTWICPKFAKFGGSPK
jgi:hypothetical protein